MFFSLFMQKHRCSRNTGDKIRPIKTTEIKLTILIIVYFVIDMYGLTVATVNIWHRRVLQSEITEYSACEALGNDAGDCSKDVLKSFQSTSIASAININTLIIYPVCFLFVFMIDYRSCFRLWNKLSQTTISSMQDHSSQSPGNSQHFKLSRSPATSEHVQSSDNVDISV